MHSYTGYKLWKLLIDLYNGGTIHTGYKLWKHLTDLYNGGTILDINYGST